MKEHTTPSNAPIPTPVMTPPAPAPTVSEREESLTAAAKGETAEAVKTAKTAKPTKAGATADATKNTKSGATADAPVPASESAQKRADTITEEDFTALMDGRFRHLLEARIKSELDRASAEHGDPDASDASEPSEPSERAPAAAAEKGDDPTRDRIEKARADLAARRRLSAWLREAAQAKENYPGFDLSRELRGRSGARFRALLRSGVDMSTAYEVVHSREIIPAAIRAAAREIEDKITGGVISGSIRPTENALGGGGSLPAMLGIGVSHMSRADRDDIARRVARGEVIRL